MEELRKRETKASMVVISIMDSHIQEAEAEEDGSGRGYVLGRHRRECSMRVLKRISSSRWGQGKCCILVMYGVWRTIDRQRWSIRYRWCLWVFTVPHFIEKKNDMKFWDELNDSDVMKRGRGISSLMLKSLRVRGGGGKCDVQTVSAKVSSWLMWRKKHGHENLPSDGEKEQNKSCQRCSFFKGVIQGSDHHAISPRPRSEQWKMFWGMEQLRRERKRR